MPATWSHIGSAQTSATTTQAHDSGSGQLAHPVPMAHHQRDQPRHRDGDRHVPVREVALHDQARREQQPRCGPPPPRPRRRRQPQHTPQRHQHGELLARLDQHEAALVDLQEHGGGHRREHAASAEQSPRHQPHPDDRRHVHGADAEGGAPVRVELRERGQQVELQRPEVVEPHADDPRAVRPRADERVVTRQHVARSHREVGGVEQRHPARSPPPAPPSRRSASRLRPAPPPPAATAAAGGRASSGRIHASIESATTVRSGADGSDPR